METKTVKAFGTGAADAPLEVLNIERREVLPHDVEKLCTKSMSFRRISRELARNDTK